MYGIDSLCQDFIENFGVNLLADHLIIKSYLLVSLKNSLAFNSCL